MPTYNLRCDVCLQDIEMRCSISDYDEVMKHVECPNCTSRNVYRNYEADNIYSSVKDVKTIGQLADKNAKLNRTKISEANSKKKESEPQQEQPWYQNAKYGSASFKEINKMSNEQKVKYIMEGRK